MRNNINKNILLLLFIVAGAWVADLNAQVVVPFKQRTAAATPAQKIYNLKGDFQMIGNKNITAQTYQQEGHNAVDMVYVDIDGDPQTLNSSSATLEFPAETDVDHNCSEIVFAGLYWTGRAHDGNTGSPNSFMGGGSTNDKYNGNSFNGYTLAITAVNAAETDGRIATYTFTPNNGGDAVVFRFHSWRTGSYWSPTYHGTVTVQIGSGAETTVNGSLTSTSSDKYTFTFSSPYSINTGTEIIFINSLTKRRTNNSINYNYFANVTGGGKLLEKNKVQFKKAGQSYETITANEADIYYPVNNSDVGNYMYAAYAEVTDYVKQHGTGQYFVADVALREGNGGGTGYYGGWGLIVIYENPKMKWRDITIFDGYAYVQGSTTISHELPVSGFRTAQNGDIRIKMGLIAGEGDRGISGDYFQIRDQANTNWVNLSHSGNSINNFFNGSIPGGNSGSNPYQANNYGLDIAMFEVPNPNNSIIGNDQTSTRFRYGSTQDTYIISTIALAVDAYVPDVRAFVSLVSPGQSGGVAPGDEIEYTLQLSNASNEEIINVAMDIPIPYTATHVSSSATYSEEMTTGDQPVYNETEGGNFIHWNVGTLPEPADPNNPTTLATLTFKLQVTNNCDILVMDNCLPTVAVNGKISGLGVNSMQNFSDIQFITGYSEASGGCESVPEYGPLNIDINIGDHCPNAEQSPTFIDNQVFLLCNGEPAGNIYNIVKPNYPAGTRFYDEVITTEFDNGVILITPTANATEYTIDNDFPEPAENTAATYYAVPYGSSACAWDFTIEKGICTNYWVGTNTTDWNTASNWSRNEIPEAGDDVLFATVANNNGQAAVNDLYVPANDPKVIGNLVNASDKNLVVTPASFLTVNGKVTDDNADAGTIIVQADPADLQPAGTLIFTTPSENAAVAATAQFYSRAYQCTDCGTYNQSWQYFGIPVQSAASFPVNDVDGTETVNIWTENIDGNKWQTATFPMTAFKGYEITNNVTSKPNQVYSFVGTLNVGDATVALSRTADVIYSGVNLVGNSFTAAIPISEAAFVFPADVNKTLYLFNTGTRDEWRKLNGTTVTGHKSGQYLGVPVNLGGQQQYPDIIPSTHAFMVLAEEGFTSGNLTINYNQLVKNEKVNLGNGEMVVTRGSNDEYDNYDTALPNLTIDVIGKGSADRLWIFTKEGTTFGFDNGWDGYKMEEFGFSQIYAVGNDWENRFQVTTVPELNNLLIGFQTEVDGDYTLEFALSDHFSGQTIYLHDMSSGARQRVENNGFYSFHAKGGDYGTRFRLSYDMDISDDSQLFVSADDRQIVITNYSAQNYIASIFTIDGKFVRQMEVKSGSTERTIVVSKGVYAVRLQNPATSIVRKVVVK